MGRMDDLIKYGREHGCSDIHLTYGMEPVARCNGNLMKLSGYGTMDDAVLEEMLLELLQKDNLKAQGDGRLSDMSLCYEAADGTRNRVSIYHQKKHIAIAIRLLSSPVPTLEELQFPSRFRELTRLHQGLILVTGPAGSGKSTALAACVEEINRTARFHILTIEDPIEYVYQNKNCLISQREVGTDTVSFAEALRSALKEDPDVILVGEMSDPETISAAITAAETGHLVFAAISAVSAAAAIERITGACLPHQQGQMQARLAAALKAVVSVRFAPAADESGRVWEKELLFVDEAAADGIREGSFKQ